MVRLYIATEIVACSNIKSSEIWSRVKPSPNLTNPTWIAYLSEGPALIRTGRIGPQPSPFLHLVDNYSPACPRRRRKHGCSRQDRQQLAVEAEPLRAGDRHCRCSVRSGEQHPGPEGRTEAAADCVCAGGEQSRANYTYSDSRLTINLQVEVTHGKKAIIIFVPVPLLQAFHKIQQR